jgi:MFS-type transporter involved in bile tolerance (Atg22 family)
LFVRERGNGAGVSYREARARAWGDLKRLTLHVMRVRWLRLFFLSFMFSAASVAAVGLFMVPYAKEIIGLSEQRRVWLFDELSFFLFVATSFSVVAALPSGSAATRWGEFRVLMATAIVWGVAFLVVAVADNLWVFLVAGALAGAAYAAGRVATRAVLLKAVGAEDSSKIFAVLGVAFKMAVLVGTGLWALVIAIAKATQVDDPQRYAVVAMFALMLVSIFLLRDAMREKRKTEAAEKFL